jgi:hypothetical protein
MDHVEVTGAGTRQLLYRSALRVPSFRECRVEDMQADGTVMFHWCFFLFASLVPVVLEWQLGMESVFDIVCTSARMQTV